MRWLPLLVLAIVFAGTSGSRAEPSLEEEFPELLSKWRLLEVRDGQLVPRNATVYDLNSALFSDYALKLRTISIPEGTSVQILDGELIFPVGTIISKTFYYPRARSESEERTAVLKTTDDAQVESLEMSRFQLIETRLLINTESGWQALPYVWNDEQTDATLQLAGEAFALTLTDGKEHDDFEYLVPDANQCSGCHAVGDTAIAPIGLKVRHLNKQRTYGTRRQNQLEHWQQTGLLTGNLPADAPRTAKWDDDRADLNARARAYLDVNCAHCHSEQGAANTSGLLLDPEPHDPVQLGICKPPVATGRGSGNDSYAIVPGSPRQSIMSYRMQSTEPDIAMPELGRSLVHKEGVELINAWIRSLKGSCEDDG